MRFGGRTGGEMTERHKVKDWVRNKKVQPISPRLAATSLTNAGSCKYNVVEGILRNPWTIEITIAGKATYRKMVMRRIVPIIGGILSSGELRKKDFNNAIFSSSQRPPHTHAFFSPALIPAPTPTISITANAAPRSTNPDPILCQAQDPSESPAPTPTKPL